MRNVLLSRSFLYLPQLPCIRVALLQLLQEGHECLSHYVYAYSMHMSNNESMLAAREDTTGLTEREWTVWVRGLQLWIKLKKI